MPAFFHRRFIPKTWIIRFLICARLCSSVVNSRFLVGQLGSPDNLEKVFRKIAGQGQNFDATDVFPNTCVSQRHVGQGWDKAGQKIGQLPPHVILAGDRIESGLDLKWRHIGVVFEQEGHDRRNVRAGKAVARQISISAAWPSRFYVDARSGQFNDFAVVKSELIRVRLVTLDHRDQR
jgi:hypothetical protein